jgi:hypothetical protein
LVPPFAPHIEFATPVHETTHTLLHFSGDKPDLTTRETDEIGTADFEQPSGWPRLHASDVPGVPPSVEHIARSRAEAKGH